MQIAGLEFRLSDSNDNEFGEELLVWAGDVADNAQEIAEEVAEKAKKEGFRRYAAITEQRGCEGDEYPVVYLLPKVS